ncbi:MULTISPECIES: hypothetical protein [unclassified Bradyrhizobium]|uniref:hypothetical protein n=1 Tax=unclassified Bradyrhizobium TaxID=2631580 RepID=UPI003390DC96
MNKPYGYRALISRAERRLAKQLNDCADQLTLDDCKFCDTRGRSYRVRKADACEIAQMEMQLGFELVMPRGRALYAIVKRIPVAKQTVLKTFTESDIGLPTDDNLDDEFCGALFESIAPPEALEAEQDYLRAKS